MKVIKSPLIRPALRGLVLALAVTALSGFILNATPYASQVTVSSGTVTFWLNEGGGYVTVTYDNGSVTDGTYNGVSTVTSGSHTFSMSGHSNYAISVAKTNSAAPGPIVSGSVIYANLRGIDVNKNPTSSKFGRIYFSIAATGTKAATKGGFYSYNPNLTVNQTLQNTSVAWDTSNPGYDFSPYQITIQPDDYLLVGDCSVANSGVWRIPGSLSGTANQLIGPLGQSGGEGAGVHGVTESRPILTGPWGNASANLYFVDGDFPSTAYNSILEFNDIGTTTWTAPPSAVGPEVGVNVSWIGLYNLHAQISRGPNGYWYASTYRLAFDIPTVQVFDSSFNPLWNSLYSPGVADYFVTAYPGTSNVGAPDDSSVSPDGKFLAVLNRQGHWNVVSLTNGIPDMSTLFAFPNAEGNYSSSYYQMAWDAADNLYQCAAANAYVDSYTILQQATAITAGDSTGSTNFQLVLPQSQVSVSAVAPALASQANSYGNPTTGTFTLSRSGAVGSALTVNFSLGGTRPPAGPIPPARLPRSRLPPDKVPPT